MTELYSNLFLLKAFTKRYAIPGLRLGYGISRKQGTARKNGTGSAAVECLGSGSGGRNCGIGRGCVCKKSKSVDSGRESISQKRTYPAWDEMLRIWVNYIFFRGEKGMCEGCRRQGILIRDCQNYLGLSEGFYRVAVRTRNENKKLIERDQKMARSIMIQGTMSNAGKSLIAAGLCRIFAQDGYKTAPFKSQNMALNSFITEDGLEMGRAQVVQAEAAGVKPSAYMNPILLKPTTDIGSQVIVNGVSIGNMRAKDYFAYKKQLIPRSWKHTNTWTKNMM